MENPALSLAGLTHLQALAAALEAEGWLNNAKLLRAAIESHLTRLAYAHPLPSDRESLLAETDRALRDLPPLDLPPALLDALAAARTALAAGSLPLYAAAPDPLICRTCGFLSFSPAACPVCGAHPATFHRLRPTYWINAFDPFTCLEHLRTTPQIVAALLPADEAAAAAPGDGGWSLREAVTHLKDSQGVLDYRIGLILDRENPVLESQAVFEWAGIQQAASTAEIFAAYRLSRQRTLARLENLPLPAWWRTGQHTEFGELKLFQQASYFTCHELAHIAQIKRLAETPA